MKGRRRDSRIVQVLVWLAVALFVIGAQAHVIADWVINAVGIVMSLILTHMIAYAWGRVKGGEGGQAPSLPTAEAPASPRA